jgi:repressor LexA
MSKVDPFPLIVDDFLPVVLVSFQRVQREYVMLTLSEQKTFKYIKSFIEQHVHAPTTSEIARGIGITSRGVVHRYLKALEQKGYIKLTPNRHRNVVLVENGPQSIPLVGSIAAGNPIEAVEQNEPIDLLSIFLGRNRFALKVKGDSMIEDGIFDADIIICEQSQTADNGQIVVALIDQQEATLKRFFRHDEKTISLLPANTTHKPQIYSADRVLIQGIYIGLLRTTC